MDMKSFSSHGKVEISEGVKRKTEFLYINDIVNLIETHNIVLNLDHGEIQRLHKKRQV